MLVGGTEGLISLEQDWKKQERKELRKRVPKGSKNRKRGRGFPLGWAGSLTTHPIALPVIVASSSAEHFKGKDTRGRNQPLSFPPAHPWAELPACSFLQGAWRTQPANQWPQYPACSTAACPSPWEDQGLGHSAGLVASASFSCWPHLFLAPVSP